MLNKVVIMEINVEAYPIKESAGGGFRAYVAYKPEGEAKKVREFLGQHDDQQVAWAEAWARMNEVAEGQDLTVAHFRSDRFRKIYSVWAWRKAKEV